MPFRSKSQNRYVRWLDAHPAEARAEGHDPTFAKKFIADSAGQKVSKLPERAAKKAHGGRAFTMKPRSVGW